MGSYPSETSSSEEEMKFTNKIKTLKNYSKKINEKIDMQNKQMKNMKNNFEENYLFVLENIKRMRNFDFKRFNTFYYYIGAIVIFTFIFFIFFIVL